MAGNYRLNHGAIEWWILCPTGYQIFEFLHSLNLKRISRPILPISFGVPDQISGSSEITRDCNTENLFNHLEREGFVPQNLYFYAEIGTDKLTGRSW